MILDQGDLLALLRLVDVTEPQEIDCTELLHRVAAFVEALGSDVVPPPGFEDVAQHLKICPECREEVEALYRVYRAQMLEASGSEEPEG